MDENITKKLIDMKAEVEEAGRQVAQLQGRLDGLYERFKKEFSIETIEEADTLLIDMDKKLLEMEAELNKSFNSVSADFQKAKQEV